MTPQPRGYLMLMAIVFGAIFLTVLGALTGFVLTENRAQTSATVATRATAIAEAGLEYYRWYLAHNPTDLTNGTGQPGPYVIPYDDPEGGQTGTFTLSIDGNTSCGDITSIDIESTGTPIESPQVSRTLTARYARPTVAQFSYVLNSSVWAGEDRVIYGPYHSNGGIRMDGTANSPVTSSLEEWTCTSEFGCSRSGWSYPTVDGVWGDGGDQALWEFPVPQVDFAGIAADFSSLKTKAIASGRYISRHGEGTNKGHQAYWNGYHLIFNGNGTVTVNKVNSTTLLFSTSINTSEDTLPDRTLIASEAFYTTLTLPADCALIYVEDNAWVEGVVDRKVTLVAANAGASGISPNVMLPGNLTYAETDGSDGLTIIAENNILITPNSPQNMTLNGIFVAQGGAFGRNYYWRGPGDSRCHTTYEPRTSLTILGTTVSNLRTGTKWMGVNCGTDSEAGYNQRTDAFDRKLSTDPPPFTPQISSDYEFVEWRED